MTAFKALLSEFAEATGVAVDLTSDSVSLSADGTPVYVQHRADKDDIVIFTFPVGDSIPERPMMARALELSFNGSGTGGNFLGIRENAFVLSCVVPLEGLTAEAFAKRMLALCAASDDVGKSLMAALTEDVIAEIDRREKDEDLRSAGGGEDTMIFNG